MDPLPEHAVEAPPRLLHPHAHKSVGSTARERARRTRDPTTKKPESPLTPKYKNQRKYSGAGLFCGTPLLSCGAASNIL